MAQDGIVPPFYGVCASPQVDIWNAEWELRDGDLPNACPICKGEMVVYAISIRGGLPGPLGDPSASPSSTAGVDGGM